MARHAWFLDRDGTLIEHVPYLHDPAGVVLRPTVREALATARARGDRLFLHTNQSGVGRGWFTLAQVEACNLRMLELIGLGEDLFDGICIAPEAPEQPSDYRKPSPRFVQESLMAHGLEAAEATMIGDSPVDWQTGLAAGIRAIAVDSENARAHDALRRSLNVPLAATLAEAMAGWGGGGKAIA